MKINYILSETTSGATSAAIREIIKKAEADLMKNVIVIVPEPKSMGIERELLDVSKAGAFANVFVYSFVRLLSRIGGIKETDVVTKQTCVMLVRQIILQNLDKLTCYKKTAKTVGFAEKIYETIAQFKASSLTPLDVRQVAEKSSGALKSKMQDISLLFDLYEQALGESFFDDCDRLRKLGEFARTNKFLQEADVFVVGFDNVTSDMLDVLKELATHSKSITFSCVYFNENRKDKYIQNNELYHKFASIAEKLKYPYNPVFVKSSHSGDFWNIQNYLYSTENKSVQSNGSVSVFEFDNKSKELEFVANQILTDVKNGKRFRDIAVIDAELEKDIDAISKTFDEFDIPYFISKPYNVVDHFFVRFFKLSIEVLTSNFSAEKVLRWLSNPLIDLENYSEFENFVKEFGINYSAFNSWVSEKQVEDDEKRERLNKTISFVKEFNKKFGLVFSAETKISNFVQNLKELSDFIDIQKKLEKISEIERKNGLEIEAEISDVIFEKFNKICENLTRFLGEQVVSAVEFLQIFMSGFSEEEVNLVPVSVDSVFVQKKADGLYKIKNLFVVGAVDGVFPVKMADTGILQDAELEGSSEIVQKRIEPTIKEINKREKFSQFEIMLIPSEKLYVSYSLHTGGAVNKPANVVSRLMKLFGIKTQKYYAENSFVTKKSAEKQFAKKVGEYLCGENDISKDLNEEYNKLHSVFSEHFREYIDNLSFGNQEFKISNAQEIYFVNNKTSVSQLEKYFACPYSFFANYGLRLKENKDAMLSSLDIGTIVHKFAELFTKKIKEFENINEKDFERKTKDVLTQALESLKINTQKNIAILNFVYDEAVRLAKYLFNEQQNSSFKNDSKLNEFEFFGNNAVKLKLEDDTLVSIEGKIDRIDKFGDYIRIIDYKTGKTDSDLSSIYYGKKIQLVSYLSAAEKIGNKKVAGLFFFPIHSDFVKIQQKMKNNYKMQGFLLDDIETIKYMDSKLSVENNESEYVPLKIKNNKETRETGEFQISYGRTKTFMSEKEFDDLKNYTEKLCAGAVQEILNGNIEPSPVAKLSDQESSICDYCELAGFCGKEKARFGKARRCGGEVSSVCFDLNKEV